MHAASWNFFHAISARSLQGIIGRKAGPIAQPAKVAIARLNFLLVTIIRAGASVRLPAHDGNSLLHIDIKREIFEQTRRRRRRREFNTNCFSDATEPLENRFSKNGDCRFENCKLQLSERYK